MILCSISQAAAWLWLALVVRSFWQAVLAQVLINISTGFINVIGEALIVEVSRTTDSDEGTQRSGKAARNVSEYLSLTAISMLINSYLGAFLLNYLSVR